MAEVSAFGWDFSGLENTFHWAEQLEALDKPPWSIILGFKTVAANMTVLNSTEAEEESSGEESSEDNEEGESSEDSKPTSVLSVSAVMIYWVVLL